MTDKKTWFITGAGRGMGVEFAKAALAAGHNAVPTSRDPGAVAEAVREADDLLVVELDVASTQDADARSRRPSSASAASTPSRSSGRSRSSTRNLQGFAALGGRLTRP